MRKVIALAAAAGLLITLAGCTVSAPSGTCTPTATSGDASSLVTAKGAFTDEPMADFPTPLIAKELQVTVLEKGDGPVIYDGDFVQFYATQYNGESTDVEASSASYDEAPYASFANNDSMINQIFQCVTVGSRISVAGPIVDDKTTTVFVIDIENAMHGKATGKIETPVRGMPSIVTAPDGTPGFTILDEDPPTTLKYSTLITGSGEKVKDGDTLILQYTAVSWQSKSVIDDAKTWGEGQVPRFKTMQPYDESTQLGLSAGALTALNGKTVGSQVLVVMPPSAYSSGSDIAATEGDTVVVVYDILGKAK